MIKESIYKNLEIKPYDIFFKKWGVKDAVYLDQVLDLIIRGTTGPQIAKHFNRGEQTFNRAIKTLFPEVKLQGGGQTWSNWFLTQSDYKRCYSCTEIKEKTEFSLNISNYDDIDPLCKSCKIVKKQI